MSKLPEEVADHFAIVRMQQTRDQDAAIARRAKAQYEQLTRWMIIAAAGASITGGLVLYGIEANPDPARTWLYNQLARPSLQFVLIALQAVFLAVAGYAGFVLAEGRSGQSWVAYRLRAEDGRLEVARRALEISHSLGQQQFTDAGHWFLSFVDGQRTHLKNSASKHEKSAAGLIVLGGIFAAVTALSGALVGVTHEMVVVLVAVLGVCSPALVAALSSWRSTVQNQRRATLHEETWRRLNKVGEREGEFLADVEANDLEKALVYADAVLDILREDHAGFAAAHDQATQTPRKESP